MRSRPTSLPQRHFSHLLTLATSLAMCSTLMVVLPLRVCCSIRRTSIEGRHSEFWDRRHWRVVFSIFGLVATVSISFGCWHITKTRGSLIMSDPGTTETSRDDLSNSAAGG